MNIEQACNDANLEQTQPHLLCYKKWERDHHRPRPVSDTYELYMYSMEAAWWQNVGVVVLQKSRQINTYQPD